MVQIGLLIIACLFIIELTRLSAILKSNSDDLKTLRRK